MKSQWRDGERVREVELSSLGLGRYRVRVDDAEFVVTGEVLEDGRLRLVAESGAVLAEVTAIGARRFVRLGTLEFVLDRESVRRDKAAGPQHGMSAPMPGVVTRVMVQPGDAVHKGQPLVAIEAMKMEHLVRAPRDGRVSAVAAKAGVMVQGGAPLVELEVE